MPTDITVDEVKYVLCYDLQIPLLHYVVLQPDQHLSTGQPEVELFSTEQEAIDRMIELGFNPDDYITRYTFLLYNTKEDAYMSMSEINSCLDEWYISNIFKMEKTEDLTLIGYVILVDDTIKTCLTPLQINQIMTTSSNQVIITNA